MATVTDWRLTIPESRRSIMRKWFWSIALFTLLVLIVGGTTRLTHSGLSIVDWDPIMGVIPPITHDQWQAAFERYQQFPQYQKVNQGMTLGEFQFIYFWEYLHRLLARTIGLVFLVPFLFFLAKRWMNRPLAKRAVILFALGGMQGVMGWLMVASGLVDRPSVSHYRLAAHLSLAFIIFGYAVWLARELRVSGHEPVVNGRALQRMKRGLLVVGWLLALQIVWGAFVAGLKAGFLANTFPLMGGRLIPATLLSLDPTIRNFFENQVTVQWLHRVIGTVLGIATLFVGWQTLKAPLDQTSRRWAIALITVVLLQYLLGVFTLINAVPVALGVTHQAVAMVLFGVWVAAVHHARGLHIQT
jgi:cytochrome c oxidase assembly protein subunit 15